MREVLVIGAGIHGVTIAIELAEKGNTVTVVDAKGGILNGTSGATHNRVHLGYHYPRSKETAIECTQGYHHFLSNYKDSLVFPDFYYAIEKKSNVTAQQYSDAMKIVGLDCDASWPDQRFLSRHNIEDCFKVNEACFDIWSLKKIFEKKFEELGIRTIFNHKITKALYEDNKIKLFSRHPTTDGYPDNLSVVELKVDLIVNCTYTYTNNVQKAFSVDYDLTTYKFESTEVAVVESKAKIPALTVMDGPFITILPYAGKENHYLVYDKVNSVTKEQVGTEYQSPTHGECGWNRMREHGLKYYPFFNNLKYKYSLYGSRPISVGATGDNRTTKIIKHDYPVDFYSILEGKFVSAPMIAKTFVKTIERKTTFKRKTALIGYTGFIGSNLNNEYLFTDRYNTKNIEYIEGKEYDLVISCANSSLRWKVNQNPEEDLENIKAFATRMSKVKAQKFVLISSIDVYEDPDGVYEDSPLFHGGPHQAGRYGKNRLFLEDFIKNHFEDHLIIRLPIIYGHNFKKNIIYDALNNNNLDKVNTGLKVQVYHAKHLMDDIFTAIANNIKVLNISTEPLTVKEIYKEAFGLELDNPFPSSFKYNMKTNHANLFGKEKDYMYSKSEILNELKKFKEEYESMRV